MSLTISSSIALEQILSKYQRPIDSLEFGNSTLDADCFALLSKEHLKRLKIQNTKFSFKDLEQLKLEELDTSFNFFPVSPDLSKLQTKMLNLSACGLTEDNLANVLKNVFIRNLKLCDNNFAKFADAQAFEKNHVLQLLDVTDCKVGDAFIPCVCASSSLTSLTVSYNQISETGATFLLQELKQGKLPRLLELKILNNPFGNDSKVYVFIILVWQKQDLKCWQKRWSNAKPSTIKKCYLAMMMKDFPMIY